MLAPYAPPADPDAPSPLLWGERRLRALAAGDRAARRSRPRRVRSSSITSPIPRRCATYYRAHFGPVIATFAAVADDPERRAALERDLPRSPRARTAASPAAEPSTGTTICGSSPTADRAQRSSRPEGSWDPKRAGPRSVRLGQRTHGQGWPTDARFGSSFDPSVPSADVVFPTEPVGANAAAMKSALDTKIQGDAGGTDYNAAFDTARSADPGAAGADADLRDRLQRRPLADGGSGSAGQDREDQARLAKIASDTGGESRRR